MLSSNLEPDCLWMSVALLPCMREKHATLRYLCSQNTTLCCCAVAPQPPSWYISPEELVPQPAVKPPNPDVELKAGNFGAIRSLLRVLASGVESKAMLDSVIDACRYP